MTVGSSGPIHFSHFAVFLVLMLLIALFRYRFEEPLTHRIRSNTNQTRMMGQHPQCTLADPWTNQARKVSIMVFVDISFVDLFFNWLAFYVDACGKDMLSQLNVVCMGDMGEYERVMKYYGVRCSSDSFTSTDLTNSDLKKRLESIWESRLQIIQSYLARGVDVLLTDTDAVWLKDPFRDLQVHSRNSDVVSQKGFAPWTLSEKWGACVCFGFIYLKASAFNLDLFHNMDRMIEEKTPQEGPAFKVDDQHLINFQLKAWNITWPSNMLIAGEETDVGVVMRNKTKHRITLLPHASFVRYCLPAGTNWAENSREQHRNVTAKLENAVVAHCQVASGKSYEKELFMKVYHLWRHNYSDIAYVVPDKDYKRLAAALRDPFFQNITEEANIKEREVFYPVLHSYGDLSNDTHLEHIHIAQLNPIKLRIIKKQQVLASGGNWSDKYADDDDNYIPGGADDDISNKGSVSWAKSTHKATELSPKEQAAMNNWKHVMGEPLPLGMKVKEEWRNAGREQLLREHERLERRKQSPAELAELRRKRAEANQLPPKRMAGRRPAEEYHPSHMRTESYRKHGAHY